MKERELKEKCYMEALDGSISNVKVVLNHMKKIDLQEGILEEAVLNKRSYAYNSSSRTCISRLLYSFKKDERKSVY